MKESHFPLTSAFEFVISSDVSVLPNCWSKVLLGGGILRSLFIKICPKAVTEEIQDSLSNQECQRAPTQQELL